MWAITIRCIDWGWLRMHSAGSNSLYRSQSLPNCAACGLGTRRLQGVHLAHRVFNGRQVGRRQLTDVPADARLVYGAQLMTQGDR